ncbi:MAG: hypothetical protein NC412_08450 [Roseburia sp.]|nr:hypothetical protein [Roseburia sp.]MCM1279614.1 hypothetical protein [Robinsoniella sp.]
MAKLIITAEGGKVTQTLNFLDRNIKDNRYVYANGNESGIMSNPEEIYEDIPECERIRENYDELIEAVNLGKSQITNVMRRLNELEKLMDPYVIPKPDSEREHVVTLNNDDLMKLSEIVKEDSFTTDKQIEDAIKKLIHMESK